MRKVLLILFMVFSGMALLFLEGCGGWLLLYDRTPTVTLKFEVPIGKYDEVQDKLKQFSKQKKYQYKIESIGWIIPNASSFQARGVKENMLGSIGGDENVVRLSIRNSKIKGIRRSKQDTIKLARELSNMIVEIDQVKEISFEMR